MTAGDSLRRTGRAIRQARSQRQLGLRELAARLGVSAATLSAIENGKTGLSVSRLQAIAAALQVPASDLIEAGEPTGYRPVPSKPAPRSWRDFAPLPIDPVLAAAIQAFVATGYHGASMRAIARRANLSVPGVYHHYRSKQELLVAILDVTMSDLIWRVEQARDQSDDAIERVGLVVEALALFHVRRSDLAFVGASEMRSLEPANYRRIARARDRVQELLDEEVARAIGPAGGPSVRDAGKAIATMCTSLPQWFRPGGPTTEEQVAVEYAQFALRILGRSLDAGRAG